jgi:hypothetical protein
MKHIKLFEEFLNEKIERFSDKENAKEFVAEAKTHIQLGDIG